MCSINDNSKIVHKTKQYKWVNKVFSYKTVGIFLDLAANHPFLKSNTYLLERKNWTGLCIDANPHCVELLKKKRKCRVIDTIVSENVEYLDFADNKEMSGIIDKRYDNTYPDSFYRKSTTTLNKILQNFKVIDYMSLDVEGAEESVLSKYFNFQKHKILTMTIERPSPTLCRRLFENGYLYAGMFGDAAFIHREHPYSYKYSRNSTFYQPPAKCRNHKYYYKDRIKLLGSCNSIFGCCSFPGFPPNQTKYQLI